MGVAVLLFGLGDAVTCGVFFKLLFLLVAAANAASSRAAGTPDTRDSFGYSECKANSFAMDSEI